MRRSCTIATGKTNVVSFLEESSGMLQSSGSGAGTRARLQRIARSCDGLNCRLAKHARVLARGSDDIFWGCIFPNGKLVGQ